jgi:hypothetical protein
VETAEAAANGGSEAGFFLVDDLLADPGIQLGDYRLETCRQALRVLDGGPGEPPVPELAAELLAAELNLDVGAASCPVVEEAAVGGHLVLSEIGFASDGGSLAGASEEVAEAAPRLLELLEAYNAGELCV